MFVFKNYIFLFYGQLLVSLRPRVKIGGGLGGLDPHWKAANPHCKHRIKKLGGSGFDPLALIPVNPHIENPSSIT